MVKTTKQHITRMSYEPQLAQSNFSINVHHYYGRLMENKTCMHAQLLSRVRLSQPMHCSPAGPSVHGIFQARRLQWVATSYSRESLQPRDEPHLWCPLHWQANSLPLQGTRQAQPCASESLNASARFPNSTLEIQV